MPDERCVHKRIRPMHGPLGYDKRPGYAQCDDCHAVMRASVDSTRESALETQLAEAITAREEAERKVDDLMKWKHAVTVAFVDAGFPPGDRTVILAHVREVMRWREETKDGLTLLAASEARAKALEAAHFFAVAAEGSLLLRWTLPNKTVIEWFIDDDELPFPATVAECRDDRPVHVHELVWATAEEAASYFRAALSTPEAQG